MTDIWKKWEVHYQSLGIDNSLISRDGIIFPKRFNKNLRILFVMKETNAKKGFPLTEFLESGPINQMWHTTARWAAGILNGFPEYSEINIRSKLTDALQQVAIINLKKVTGSSASNMSVVNAYAHQDRVLLLEQIQNIDPHIILSCGVLHSLIWLLDIPVKADNPGLSPVRAKKIESVVIPWRHPNRGNNEKSYQELKEMFTKEKELLSSNRA